MIVTNASYYNNSNKKWLKVQLTINIDSLHWKSVQEVDKLDEDCLYFNQISSIDQSSSYFLYPVIYIQSNNNVKTWFGSFDNFYNILNIVLHFFQAKIVLGSTGGNDIADDNCNQRIFSTAQQIRENMNISAQILDQQSEKIDQLCVKTDQIHSKITMSERFLEYLTSLSLRSRQDEIAKDDIKHRSTSRKFNILCMDNRRTYSSAVLNFLDDRIIIDHIKTNSTIIEILFLQLGSICCKSMWNSVFMSYSSNNILSELELMSAHMPEILTIIQRKSPSISIDQNIDRRYFPTDSQDLHVVSVSALFHIFVYVSSLVNMIKCQLTVLP